MMSLRLTRIGFAVLLALTLTSAGLMAVPPSPEAIEQWKAEGILEEKLANWRLIDDPHNEHFTDGIRPGFQLSAGATAEDPDTLHVLVLLVDFDDQPASIGDSARFDSLLFSVGTSPTGSMTDYYLENSYGKVFVKGEVHGWYRADSLYSWYVGATDGQFAGYLAWETIMKSDIDIDYRKFTGGTPGQFYGLTVVHAGCGAESGCYGIWSHQSTVPFAAMPDSVLVPIYSMQPETHGSGLVKIGVFCHEYGHMIGLPDFYDTDYEPPGSEGLGDWAVMASGSWNGIGGDRPSHFCAYSKIQMNWVDPIYVYDTSTVGLEAIVQAEIPQVETDPVVYKIKNTASSWFEYWLVENRQLVGFDAALPGHGLAIYHVDTWIGNNGNPDRYRVALEEADGDLSLRYGGVEGEPGDLWPGSSNNRDFTDFTDPNSRYNEDSSSSQVGVWNISDSDSLMYADLEAIFTHPYLTLSYANAIRFVDPAPGGDGDGVLEAGETIEFYLRVTNEMAQSFLPAARLTIDYPGVTWVTQQVSLGTALNPSWDYISNEGGGHGLADPAPIVFTLPAEVEAANVTCTLSILSDAEWHIGETNGDYQTDFEIEAVFGQPNVLIVDDDGGHEGTSIYRTAVKDIATSAYGIWDKSLGSPTAADLNLYETVLWNTGDPDTGGVLVAADIEAMQGFLDNGGNLMLSTAHGVKQMRNIDPTFVRDYLYCALGTPDSAFAMLQNGQAGNPVGEGTQYVYGVSFSYYHDNLHVYSPADTAFRGQPAGVSGLTYAGEDYKLVLLTIPIEYLRYEMAPYTPRDTLWTRIFDFFDGSPTSVEDPTLAGLPGSFNLSQNYPNPFNPSTIISYTIPGGSGTKATRTRLMIYNVLGQEVRTLVDKAQAPGGYTVEWNGTDNSGEKVSTGIYLYRLTYGDRSETRKMVLLK